MGNLVVSPEIKWEWSDCLFIATTVVVEMNVPTSDPLLFSNFQRRRYGAKLIHKVEAAGTKSVKITAFDCTPYEAAKEYFNIVTNQHENNEEDEV